MNFQNNKIFKKDLNDWITRWTLSGFDPTDLRRPPALPPESAGFGTVKEKRLSNSDTSNSGALGQKSTKVSYSKGFNNIKKSMHYEVLWNLKQFSFAKTKKECFTSLEYT